MYISMTAQTATTVQPGYGLFRVTCVYIGVKELFEYTHMIIQLQSHYSLHTHSAKEEY